MLTAMIATPTPRRLVVIGLMRLGCTICWVTFGNGQRIAGTRITAVHQQKGIRGQQEIVPCGWRGVVLGTSTLSSCVPRAAAGTPQRTGSASTVSVLPGPIKSWVLVSLNLVFCACVSLLRSAFKRDVLFLQLQMLVYRLGLQWLRPVSMWSVRLWMLCCQARIRNKIHLFS